MNEHRKSDGKILGIQDSPHAYLQNHLQVQMVGLMFLPQLESVWDLVWGLVARRKPFMKTVEDKGLISGQVLGSSLYSHWCFCFLTWPKVFPQAVSLVSLFLYLSWISGSKTLGLILHKWVFWFLIFCVVSALYGCYPVSSYRTKKHLPDLWILNLYSGPDIIEGQQISLG